MSLEQESTLSKKTEPVPDVGWIAARSSFAAVGAGLLAQDWQRALALTIILSAPGVVTSLLPTEAVPQLPLYLSSFALELLATFYLARSIFKRCGTKLPVFELRGAILVIVFGAVIEGLVSIPFRMIQSEAADTTSRLISVAMAIPVTLAYLAYYFYFVPIAAGESRPKQILDRARELTLNDGLAALRVLAAPLALSLIVSALVTIPSPDGRALWIGPVDAVIRQASSILAVYLATAYSLLAVSDVTWRSWGLDPYRSSRLTTLSVLGNDFFAAFLRPRQALIVAGMATFIFLGNLSRAAELPPAGEQVINSIKITGGDVRLTLTLKDPQYHFRGFAPSRFILAGEKGTPLSRWPDGVEFKANPDQTEAMMVLEFKTQEKEESLRKLEDLYLWYTKARLQKLEMGKAG